MKELDKSKAYSFKSFNEHQRGELFDYLLKVDNSYKYQEKKYFQEIDSDFIHYDMKEWQWNQNERYISSEKQTINALDLFNNNDSIEVQKECLKNTFGVDFKTKSKYEFQFIEVLEDNREINLIFFKYKSNGLIKIKKVFFGNYDKDDDSQSIQDYINNLSIYVTNFLNTK